MSTKYPKRDDICMSEILPGRTKTSAIRLEKRKIHGGCNKTYSG